MHSTGFRNFRYIYDVHDVIKMGELWLTFFTPDSHAAKRRRRHLIDAAAAEKNPSTWGGSTEGRIDRYPLKTPMHTVQENTKY